MNSSFVVPPGFITTDSILIKSIGIFIAIFVIFIVNKPISLVFRALIKPLETITEEDIKKGSFSSSINYHGLFLLYVSYFFSASILSFTGGTIGMYPGNWTPQITQNYILFGFTIDQQIIFKGLIILIAVSLSPKE